MPTGLQSRDATTGEITGEGGGGADLGSLAPLTPQRKIQTRRSKRGRGAENKHSPDGNRAVGAADVAAVGDGRGVHVVGGSGAVEDRGGSPETLKSSLSHPYKCSNRPSRGCFSSAAASACFALRIRAFDLLTDKAATTTSALPLSIPLSIPLKH